MPTSGDSGIYNTASSLMTFTSTAVHVHLFAETSIVARKLNFVGSEF
jgi:hypothetical protein